MTLRASDPCRLLVLSRNAADVTEHAQLSCLANGRSRRLGVQQRALPRYALGCLVSARDLHQGAGWEPTSERRAPGRRFFFISCVVCLKIRQHDLAACQLRLEMTPRKQATESSGPRGAAKIHQPADITTTYKIKACTRQRGRSDVVVLSDGNQS